MDQEYRQELRTDSSQIIFPFTAILIIFASLAAAVTYGFSDGWHFLLYTILGALCILLAWHLIKNGYQELGGWVYTISKIIFITLILIIEYEPGQIGIYPYLYGIFIIISS